MTTFPLYSVSIFAFNGRELLRMVGSRETVIEAALRVMLDNAPAWTPSGYRPQFQVEIQEIK